MNTISEMVELHRELVEVGEEHNDAFDSFIDDDSNWINDEDDSKIPKTGDLANKWEFLSKVCDDQRDAIAKSHAAISKFASDYEDSGRFIRKTEGKLAAFFAEFGD